MGEFGGTITEFTFLTAALPFFRTAKRLILHTLLASVPSWLADLFMPASFLDPALSRGFVVFGASSAVLLVLLYFWLWESGREAAPAAETGQRDPRLAEEAEVSRAVPAADSVALFARRYDLTERLSALLEGGRRRRTHPSILRDYPLRPIARCGMRCRLIIDDV